MPNLIALKTKGKLFFRDASSRPGKPFPGNRNRSGHYELVSRVEAYILIYSTAGGFAHRLFVSSAPIARNAFPSIRITKSVIQSFEPSAMAMICSLIKAPELHMIKVRAKLHLNLLQEAELTQPNILGVFDSHVGSCIVRSHFGILLHH